MRKWMLSSVVIVVALLLAIPFIMGILTQKQVIKMTGELSQTPGVDVTVKQYQRGWFRSTADLHVKVHVPERYKNLDESQSGANVYVA